MGKQRIVLVIHNVRSSYNVGSMMRTADGLGVKEVYLTGYTPYPHAPKDRRLPHVAKSADQQIAKTALGAEKSVHWDYAADVGHVMEKLKDEGLILAALEQTSVAAILSDFHTRNDIALIVGNEVGGVDKNILNKVDLHLAIPMLGKKESFNVSVASALALYHLRWYNH